ncbi:hypothetical protein HOG48_03265 [Candidatus Peregrinibacteria bacterium]|nr:hypothetical protein [Candidatus Peregrinibacteria bacterium]
MTSPHLAEEPTVELEQDQVFRYIHDLQHTGPTCAPFSIRELADLLGVEEKELRRLAGIKSPEGREERTIVIPRRILREMFRLRRELNTGEIDRRVPITGEVKSEIQGSIKKAQAFVRKNYRKTLPVSVIADLINARRRTFHKATSNTAKTNNGRPVNCYLMQSEIARLKKVVELALSGELKFIDTHVFHGKGKKDAFRLLMTKEDIKLIDWIIKKRNLNAEEMATMLGIPESELAQTKADAKRVRTVTDRETREKREKPNNTRLAVDALNKLVALAEETSFPTEEEVEDPEEIMVMRKNLQELKMAVQRELLFKAECTN